MTSPRVRQDRWPEQAVQLVVVLDVIGVTVRGQEVRDRQALALDDLEQRLQRRARVDENGGSTRLVGDQVRVRQETGIDAPVNKHAR
jgi:hypothetical protein